MVGQIIAAAAAERNEVAADIFGTTWYSTGVEFWVGVCRGTPFYADGTHLNAAGIETVAELLKEGVKAEGTVRRIAAFICGIPENLRLHNIRQLPLRGGPAQSDFRGR